MLYPTPSLPFAPTFPRMHCINLDFGSLPDSARFCQIRGCNSVLSACEKAGAWQQSFSIAERWADNDPSRQRTMTYFGRWVMYTQPGFVRWEKPLYILKWPKWPGWCSKLHDKPWDANQ
jgi:hypothetical protein